MDSGCTDGAALAPVALEDAEDANIWSIESLLSVEGAFEMTAWRRRSQPRTRVSWAFNLRTTETRSEPEGGI